MAEAHDRTVFRPSTERYINTVGRPLLVAAGLGAVLLIVVGVIRPIWLAQGSVVTFILATAAVSALVALAYARWGRVSIGAQRVTSIGFFGHRRHCAREEIGTTFRVGRDRSSDSGRAIRTYRVGALYVLRRDGRRFLRLTTGFWAAAELDALAAAIDAPHKANLGDAGFEEIVRRYPHAYSWPRRHPVRTALIVVVVVFALVAVLAAVLAGLGT